VVLLAVFSAMFNLFNMFVSSVYWYLFNDVVPEQFLGRFMSWFRLVSTASYTLYNFFIYQYALSYTRTIYIGAALLYFVGFGVMCLKVREGQYPPPADTGQAPGLMRDIKTFVTECYSIPYYWNIFLYNTFTVVAGIIGVFGVFFNQSMGLDLNLIGKSGAVSGAMVMICLIFAGMLVDRWNPVRVEGYLNAFGTFFSFGSLIWLFVATPSPKVYFWVAVFSGVFSALVSATSQAAGLPRFMILFPRERFGAFCGAQALICSIGIMVGGLLSGIFLDIVKRFYPSTDLFPYRYMYLWTFFFTVLAFCFHYRAYRYWKRLGGETGYTPPTTKVRYSDLPKAKNTQVVWGLLWLPIVSFIGMILANLFYMYYYFFIVHHVHSGCIFAIYMVILLMVMSGFIWFIKFMERA
jgi:hypothetical protein